MAIYHQLPTIVIDATIELAELVIDCYRYHESVDRIPLNPDARAETSMHIWGIQDQVPGKNLQDDPT